jgi:phospholipase C/archaellum component FlaF (FlaF/FlaG flagellin family)
MLAFGLGAVGQEKPSKPPQDATAIHNFVFIVKENRTFDFMFGTYPGAMGATTGRISTGEVIPLGHAPDVLPRDIGHGWRHTPLAEDNGRMDQFDLIQAGIGQPCNFYGDYLCYTQLYQTDIPNYFSYANNFALADEAFASMGGASFPNHLYTIAATGGGVIGNPADSPYIWGCDAPPGIAAPAYDSDNYLTNLYPCFDFPTLTDLLDSASLSWKYYAPPAGQEGYEWSTLDAINHIRNSSVWAQKIVSPSQFAIDAAAGNLPNVSWIVPYEYDSEHAPYSSCQGENWTVQQINAIMQGPQWNSTAVVVIWDDYGGFYDHIYPPQVDVFGLGIRVPMLIISPYAKKGYISHTLYEFSSFLKTVEERFNLAPLTARDANANDLFDSFDFAQDPRPPLVLPTRKCPVVSPSQINFPPQTVNSVSAGRTVTISNFRTSALTLNSETITGDFRFTSTCGTRVKPQSVCHLVLTFKPTQAGPRTGTVTVTDSDPSSPQTVPVTGTGTAVSLSPSLLTFPNTVPGARSTAMMATLTNTGDSSLTTSSVTLTGDYFQSNTCGGSTIPPGGTCTFTVTFKPTVSGRRFGTIAIQDSDAGSPQVLRMTGLATALTESKVQVGFADTKVGFTSAPSSVTITNSGQSTINLSNFVIQNNQYENIPDFVQANNCTSPLPPGGRCIVNVTFTPTVIGSSKGMVEIFDDESGTSEFTVGLSGEGLAAPVVSLSPNSVSFPDTSVGTSSNPVPVTLTNTGSATLNLSGISVQGDFSQTNNCPPTVTVGSSCVINVAFSPTQKGLESGSITLTDDAGDSPQTIALSGNGAWPPHPLLR